MRWSDLKLLTSFPTINGQDRGVAILPIAVSYEAAVLSAAPPSSDFGAVRAF